MFQCHKCGKDTYKLSWLREKDGWCSECFHSGNQPLGQSSMIATDGIPGGLQVNHGICNPDGTPKTYYSKTDIKRAAFEAGYTISNETPKINYKLQEQRAAAAERKNSL